MYKYFYPRFFVIKHTNTNCILPCAMTFFVPLPVPELWRHNHFRVPRNTVRKGFSVIVPGTFFVEDIEKTISCTIKFHVLLPVPKLWRHHDFRGARNTRRKCFNVIAPGTFFVEDIERTTIVQLEHGGNEVQNGTPLARNLVRVRCR